MQPTDLRARSAGEILDAAFQFMRAEYAALVLGTGAFLMPPLVLKAAFPGGGPFWDLLGNLLYIAGTAVPVVLVTDHLLGRPVDLGAALSLVIRRFPALWMASIIFGLVVGVGTLLLIIPGVIAAARLFVMPCVVVAEGETGSGSFQRARDLTRGFTGHILVTLVLAYLIMFVSFMGAVFAIGLGLGMLGMSDAGAEFLSGTLLIGFYPFVSVVTAMLYLDLRVRKEALDVQLMAEALAEPAQAAAAV